MPFASLGLPPALVRGVRAAGYHTPTPVQLRAIPLVLQGVDVVAAAQTGSGKTAAFVLPILTKLLERPAPTSGGARLRALVLAPTRELAAQIETAARDLARFTRVRIGVVYGGVNIGPQERMLRGEGVDFLVATPGRLLDLNGRQSVALDDVAILVLDEADRMADMGFAPDLKRILRLLPRKRQTLLFSATMPPALNDVARDALTDPVRVDLAPPSRPAAGITQAVYPVSRGLKTTLLDALLRRADVSGVIVFTRTKRGAERLARQLEKLGHPVAALHGDRTQSQRERALRDLRRGRVQVLVATDIASRGIDVEDLTHVINFDVPAAPEDYVHRIGRTGRAEATGDAFTLMSPEEERDMKAIEHFIGRSILRVTVPDFDYKQRPAPQGDGAPARSRGDASHGRAHADSGRGRGHDDRARVASRPAAPEAGPAHGRRPKRDAPGGRRRRM
jgi:ATP-dependent RNA helicase RhlE